MKDPNTLLKEAVESIVDNVSQAGMTPHDAVVKAAQEYDLNVNFIKRASEAINVALTHAHFKNNPSQRDQDFPIVDAEKVASEVFSLKPKTAEEMKSEWFPDMSKMDVNFNKLTLPNVKQAFTEILCQSETHDSFPLSEAGLRDKCGHYIDNLESHVDRLETKQAEKKFDISRSFSRIVESFSKAAEYRPSFESFEREVNSAFGSRGSDYVELIYASSGLDEKRANFAEPSEPIKTSEAGQLFTSLLDSVTEYNKVAAEVEVAYETLTNDKGRIKQAFLDLSNIRNNIGTETLHVPAQKVETPAAMDDESDPVMTAAKAKMEQSKEELDESYLTEGQKRLPHHLKRAIIHKKKNKTAEADPALKEAGVMDLAKGFGEMASHEPKSKVTSNTHTDNLDRKLMLQDMMMFDPILSTMEPKRVGELYEQFMRIAPELSKEKEIVRSSLRTMGQGQGVDPFTANSYIDTNSNVLKQRKLMEGQD